MRLRIRKSIVLATPMSCTSRNCPPSSGSRPKRRVALPEPGLGGRDAEVARQGQRETGLDGHTVDRGDRELVQAPHRHVQRLGDRAQPLVGADRVGVPGGNVGDEPERRVSGGRPLMSSPAQNARPGR